MKLFKDEELIAEGSLEELLKIRKKSIYDTLIEFEENGYCDKYAFEDWLFNIDENKELNFYLNEGPGVNFEIKE